MKLTRVAGVGNVDHVTRPGVAPLQLPGNPGEGAALLTVATEEEQTCL